MVQPPLSYLRGGQSELVTVGDVEGLVLVVAVPRTLGAVEGVVRTRIASRRQMPNTSWRRRPFPGREPESAWGGAPSRKAGAGATRGAYPSRIRA